MTPAEAGSLISASFGTLFILLNTGALPSPVQVLLRAGSAAAMLAVVAATAVRPSPGGPGTGDPQVRGGFTRGYWLVVAVEGATILAGLALINTVLHAPRAAIAWIATVVGLHFPALAAVWKIRVFHLLGAAITLCGATGLLLASSRSTSTPVELAAGVLPGSILLSFAVWGATRHLSKTLW